MPLKVNMGKKRKFVDVFKNSTSTKCSTCTHSQQNENCLQCSSSGNSSNSASATQEPPITQPAKRSLLHQILRHGLNVQTKTNSSQPASIAVTVNSQKPSGLWQHFKMAKLKDGFNYIKGKELEPFLSDSPIAESKGSMMETSFSNSRGSELSLVESIKSYDTKTLNGEVKCSSSILETFPPLKPLFFEVPTTPDSVFIGRNWLFTDMERILTTESNHRGIIITGNEGTGKTGIILQLVEHSCFGRLFSGSTPTGAQPQQPKRGPLQTLASKLVAYHFCQVDYRISCLVPEFVHSIAAQLCQAPQLTCYRHYLANNPSVQNSLSKLKCLMKPDEALLKGILDPLKFLHESGKIPNTSSLFLVIDSVCEADYHGTDMGESLSTFLAKHIHKFPNWLKIIMTTRSGYQDFVSGIPLQEITLNGDLHSRDLRDYINFRIKQGRGIKRNVSGSSSGAGLERFKRHLSKISKGNFLFLKLLLDCIEQGSIQIKSSNYKVLPHTLAELFLLECNLRFPTLEDFNKIEPILSTCLAALNPLSLLEIYHSVNSLDSSTENIPWVDFAESIQTLSSFLTPRSDGTFMFFHASFREWLIHREDTIDKKYKCDTRVGDAAISFRLSRIEAPLSPEKTLELGHHILKAHIYHGHDSVASKDLQAFWLASSSQDLSQTLGHPAAIYYPNFRVTRLLLIAGASANYITEMYNKAPILGVAAAEGQINLMSILLEFGADIEAVNSDGDTALHLAAQGGHVDAVTLLIKNGASLDQLNHASQCPFLKAVLFAKEETGMAEHLLKLMDDPSPVIRRALVAMSNSIPDSKEKLQVLENVLRKSNVNLDIPDGISGETPLTAAVKAGRVDLVEIVLNKGGNPNTPNLTRNPPLNLAADGGHYSLVKILILNGCSLETKDSLKRTPLIEAIVKGHFEIVDLLISEGADINAEDGEGMNSLSWACFHGHSKIAQFVLAHGADANQPDKLGRTPLDLAAYSGSEEIAQLLLDHGALLERTDLQGVRPLDRAVGNGHLNLAQFFLRSGAKINTMTWAMANGKDDITLVLLNKLLEEGLALCKSGQLREAVNRFQCALRKIPTQSDHDAEGENSEIYRQLRISILLHLSRCKRNLREPVEAMNLATESIKLDPNSYKTWFARSKAYQCLRAISESLHDCSRAIELANQSGVKKRLLIFKENITRDYARGGPRSFSPSQFSTNSLKLSRSRPNLTSSGNVNGNGYETLKPKASTSNCLLARKSLVLY